MKIQASYSRVTLQDFPVEIIHLIFVYSLPDDPLDHKQPDIRIAPMLLCRVCSQWRSIAFQSPGLWAYLYHCISTIPGEEPVRRTRIYPIDLEFLEWWRWNLNETHAFHFRLNASCYRPIFLPEDEPDVQEHVLLTLFNLSRHLDINCKVALSIHINRESLALSLPNLETLYIRHDVDFPHSASQFFPLLPEHPIPKLHIQNFQLDDVYKRPIVLWSSLTHLIFEDVYISTGEWFDLLRACVNLQFGHFDAYIQRDSDHPHLANPPHFTHRHLRELVIRWHDNYYSRHLGRYSLKNLSLPSLTTLRLSVPLRTQDLDCILDSLPSFTTLYWVAGNSIWFRSCDDGHILQIHSRRITPPNHPPNRNHPTHSQGVIPRHSNHPAKFVCVYRRGDDRIYQQSLFVELFATGRTDK